VLLLGLYPDAGLAQDPEQRKSAEPELTLEQILSQQLGDADYVDETACVNMDQVKDTEVLDEHHVVFRVNRNEYWLATIKMRCPGLRPGVPVQFEKRSRSVCQGDSVRAPFGMTFDEVRWGPACNLSRFQSITPEQLALPGKP